MTVSGHTHVSTFKCFAGGHDTQNWRCLKCLNRVFDKLFFATKKYDFIESEKEMQTKNQGTKMAQAS